MARGDAALGDEDKEPGEELVDGVEFGKLGEESRGEVEGIIGRLPNVEISGDPLTLLARLYHARGRKGLRAAPGAVALA